jgi:uncharacterized SAM-dependent methyltransferase
MIVSSNLSDAKMDRVALNFVLNEKHRNVYEQKKGRIEMSFRDSLNPTIELDALHMTDVSINK